MCEESAAMLAAGLDGGYGGRTLTFRPKRGRPKQGHGTSAVDPELSFLAVLPSERFRRKADYQVPCDQAAAMQWWLPR